MFLRFPIQGGAHQCGAWWNLTRHVGCRRNQNAKVVNMQRSITAVIYLFPKEAISLLQWAQRGNLKFLHQSIITSARGEIGSAARVLHGPRLFLPRGTPAHTAAARTQTATLYALCKLALNGCTTLYRNHLRSRVPQVTTRYRKLSHATLHTTPRRHGVRPVGRRQGDSIAHGRL